MVTARVQPIRVRRDLTFGHSELNSILASRSPGDANPQIVIMVIEFLAYQAISGESYDENFCLGSPTQTRFGHVWFISHYAELATAANQATTNAQVIIEALEGLREFIGSQTLAA